MKKKIISLVCAFCMAFPLISCDNSEEEYHNTLTQEISALTQQISSLTEQINDLTGELEALKAQQSADSEELKKQLQEQTEEMELMQKKLENLMGLPIEFTAEKPIYGRRETEEVVASFDVGDPPEGIEEYDAFSAFKNYVQNNLSVIAPYTFYFLDPSDGEVGFHGRYKTYRVTAESVAEGGTLVSPMLDQYMMIEDEVLVVKDLANSIPTGFSWNLCLHAYFAPLPQDFMDYYRIKLEFGNSEATMSFSNKYFNIYLDGTCIGTCYYQTKAYVSKTWFENYIYNNLLRSN